LAHAPEEQAPERHPERDAHTSAGRAEGDGLAEYEAPYVSVHGAHAAEKSDLPPPRGDRGADGAPRDEDRREQREARDSGQQRPIGTEVALDLLATPRRRHRLEARRGGERGIDRAGRVVDRHTRAE